MTRSVRRHGMTEDEIHESHLWTPPAHRARGRDLDDPHYLHGTLRTMHNPFESNLTHLPTDRGFLRDYPDEMADPKNHRYIQEASDNVHRVVNAGHPLIAVGGHALEKILDEGKVRSQFETHSSGGTLNHFTRAMTEHSYFGYPTMHQDRSYDPEEHGPDHATLPRHRPIYGHIAHDPIGQHVGTQQYGAHSIVLHKPSIWHRTTVTMGDSLGRAGHLTPRPASKADIHAADVSPHWDEGGGAGPMSTTPPHVRRDYLHEKLEAHTSRYYRHADQFPGRYIEAQYHGGVNTDHFHYVVLAQPHKHMASFGSDDPYERHERLKHKMDEQGIPWVERGTHTQPDEIIGRGKHANLHDRVVRYQDLLVRAAIGGGAMSERIIAQRGPCYLIALGGGRAQVADTESGRLYAPDSLQAILARGYWEDPKPGVDVEDVLALVKPV